MERRSHLSRDLPPEDRARSAYTGWTRAHWERIADHLLEGVRPYATLRQALIHLPGGRPSRHGHRVDGLEGFARTFLLAAYRLAGAQGAVGGSLVERYAEGLAAGTTARGPEKWPAITRNSQAMVEATSIALALAETRPWIWDALDDSVRQRVVSWLAAVEEKRARMNNWQLFPVVVGAFLRSIDASESTARLDAALDRVDEMYRGHGWYVDGGRGRFDHYAGWAFTFYTLMWCRLEGDRTDPARAAVYRERARMFLGEYRLLFGANGSPLHYGRSLLYRFGAVAPFWAGELLGVSPLDPGETRRLASGSLRYFLERGAVSDGVLTMGYHGEFLPATQRYSGPASPYWASKAFLGLLLPADAAAWTADEQGLAVEQGDFTCALDAPAWLVWGTAADGVVRALTGGGGNDPHYRKLAYSTHTGPETGRGADIDGESTVLVRRPRRRWARAETASFVKDGAEIRVLRPRRSGVVRTGGFAVAGELPPVTAVGDGWALARRCDDVTSFVASIYGFARARVEVAEERNAFGRHSVVPLVEGTPGSGGFAAALVLLTGTVVKPEDVLRGLPSASVSDNRLRLVFGDGERIEVSFSAGTSRVVRGCDTT